MILYYFPKVKSVDITPELLKGSGLAHLAGLELMRNDVIQNGPDGGEGGLIAYVGDKLYTPVSKLGYYKTEQTWKQYGGIWVGWYTDKKPTPENLIKRDCAGFVCETDMGKFIISPQRFMPNKVRLLPNGKVEYQVKEEGGATLELLESVLSNFNDEQITPDQIAVCVMAIGINYRIGTPECYALDIFDSKTIYEIIQAVSDNKALEMVIAAIASKKKADDTVSLDSGEVAS